MCNIIQRFAAIALITTFIAASAFAEPDEVEVPAVGVVPDAHVIAALKKNVSVDFKAMRIDQAFAEISKSGGVSLHPDWNELVAIGVDKETTITLRLNEIPLESVLNHLARLFYLASPEVLPEGDHIRIGERPSQVTKIRSITKRYDLTELIKSAGLPASPESTAMFAKMVHDHVAADSWVDVGGLYGVVKSKGSAIDVSTQWQQHEQIDELLTMYRARLSAHEPASFPGFDKTQKFMREKMVPVKFDGTLADAVNQWQAATGINVENLNDGSQIFGDFDRDAVIHVASRAAPAGDALSAILASARLRPDTRNATADYEIDPVGVVVISSTGPRFLVRCHDIRRLLVKLSGEARKQRVDQICSDVRKIDPNGFTDFSEEIGGILVVSESYPVQQKIAALVASMR